MNRNKAKLKYNPNNFEIVEEGDYVECAVSGKNIPQDRNSNNAIINNFFKIISPINYFNLKTTMEYW